MHEIHVLVEEPDGKQVHMWIKQDGEKRCRVKESSEMENAWVITVVSSEEVTLVFFFFNIFIFIYLAVPHLGRSMQDLWLWHANS